MNPHLNLVRKHLFSADEWLKIIVYTEKPNPATVRKALEDVRMANAILQQVDNECCGQQPPKKDTI